jgi:hypothetical protein
MTGTHAAGRTREPRARLHVSPAAAERPSRRFPSRTAPEPAKNHEVGPCRPTAAVICAVLATGACTVEGAVGRDPRSTRVVADVPDHFRDQLDLLLVVDNGGDGSRVGVDVALRHIHEYLGEVEDGRLDLRIGVTSSDLGSGSAAVAGCSGGGDGGRLLVAADPACASLAGGYLELVRDGDLYRGNLPGLGDASVDRDHLEPLLTAAIQCLTALPTTTCAYPQPLAALERALDPAVNPGFVRDGAALGVVLVAGEDDCSARDPAFYAEGGDGGAAGDDRAAAAFRCFDQGVVCDGDDVGPATGAQTGCRAATRGELTDVGAPAAALAARKPAGAVVVAGAIGDTDAIEILGGDGEPRALAPSCERDDQAIYPSVRLGDFVGRFARRAIAPMCERGAAAIAAPTGAELRQALGHRCLDGDIRDVDPGTPGLQWDCAVTAVAGDGRRTSLEACHWAYDPLADDGPCFVIRPGLCTDFPTELSVFVNWGGPTPTQAPLGVRTEVACQVDE